MKDEALENSLIYQYNNGWSIRRLSREYHVSFRRISRILKENARRRSEGTVVENKPKQRASKLDPFKPYIQELLVEFKKAITVQRIFELILEKGYDGKISILEDYIAKIRKDKTKEVIRCVETAPGQRAAHDWSEYMIEFTLNPEKEEKVTFFSYILAYSRRQYIEVVEDKTQRTLFECLVHAFMHFDGAVREIKSDNQKVCVDRWECGQPIFNRHYLGFASHYGFRPMAIKPGRPVENLKIERPFYYLETNFLNGRHFRNMADLKEQLTTWLTQVNDLRKHRTTGRQPIEMFTDEISFLLPLPKTHYDTSLIVYRVVNQESCIHWEGRSYFVPGDNMFKSCPVRITKEQVIIYSPGFEQIRVHAIPENGSPIRYVGLPASTEHTPKMKLSDVKQRLSRMGSVMEKYVEKVVAQKKDPGPMLTKLLALKVIYSTQDILMAVKRALDHGVYDIKTIESFLSTHAQPLNAIKTLFDQQPGYED
jgi:transposase